VTPLTIDVTEEGGAVVVTLAGEVDLANAAEVEARLFSAITNLVTTVSVDLTRTEYIDSAGLQVLFALAARLRVLQIELDLLAPPGSPARRAVELSGLDSLAPLRPG
jgi:anti-sigma B factor antagonist/stage II sporulation protein AA (anti-sigma F factor antagonist)